jgi:Group 4 capsule polysaccharide lipoprotein gfcB, YjbF
LLASRIFAFLVVFISGCASTAPTPENSAWTGLLDSFQINSSDPTASVPLSLATWYLKVQVPDTPPALMAFGYLEAHTNPPTEVWFSGGGQIIKIREGRVVATHGLTVDWKDVSSPLGWPQWPAETNVETHYTRIRSTMPGYDVGIREHMRVTLISAPSTPVSKLIPGASDLKVSQWRWYREEVVSSPRSKLPHAIFATAKVQGTTVVAYSQQCLSETFCLHIMRWPQLESVPQP